MKRKIFSSLLAASLVTLTAQAVAQSSSTSKGSAPPAGSNSKDESNGIQLADGVRLFSSLNVSYGRNDNLFLTSGARKSTRFSLVSPGVKLAIRGRQANWLLDYGLNATNNFDSTVDNSVTHKLNAQGNFSPSSSLNFGVGSSYELGTDPRGSTDRGISTVPDRWRSSGFSGRVGYGGSNATGRLEFDASKSARRYTNNRANTIVSDKDTTGFGGRFLFRIAPKTNLVFEAKRSSGDYSVNANTQNSVEHTYLVGVTWDVTSITSGQFKIGRLKKDFTSATRPDFSGSAWDVAVNWSPLTYSKVGFSTSKSTSDSTEVGNFIINKKYGVTWNHSWTSRISSNLGYTRADDDFSSSVPARTDTTDTFSLGFNYQFDRWLSMGGDFSTGNRDSSISTSNYRKNQYSLSLAIKL